jgi:hypothetical protein
MRRHQHSTCPRSRRSLGSLLLVVASAAACSTPQKTAAEPGRDLASALVQLREARETLVRCRTQSSEVRTEDLQAIGEELQALGRELKALAAKQQLAGTTAPRTAREQPRISPDARAFVRAWADEIRALGADGAARREQCAKLVQRYGGEAALGQLAR